MNIDFIIFGMDCAILFLKLCRIFWKNFFWGTRIRLGIYFYKIKKFKIFLFICISTGFGDFFGNILKDFFFSTKTMYGFHQNFPMIEKCGPELTGLPSNHTLNFFHVFNFWSIFLKNRLCKYDFFWIFVCSMPYQEFFSLNIC